MFWKILHQSVWFIRNNEKGKSLTSLFCCYVRYFLSAPIAAFLCSCISPDFFAIRFVINILSYFITDYFVCFRTPAITYRVRFSAIRAYDIILICTGNFFIAIGIRIVTGFCAAFICCRTSATTGIFFGGSDRAGFFTTRFA